MIAIYWLNVLMTAGLVYLYLVVGNPVSAATAVVTAFVALNAMSLLHRDELASQGKDRNGGEG